MVPLQSSDKEPALKQAWLHGLCSMEFREGALGCIDLDGNGGFTILNTAIAWAPLRTGAEPLGYSDQLKLGHKSNALHALNQLQLGAKTASQTLASMLGCSARSLGVSMETSPYKKAAAEDLNSLGLVVAPDAARVTLSRTHFAEGISAYSDVATAQLCKAFGETITHAGKKARTSGATSSSF